MSGNSFDIHTEREQLLAHWHRLFSRRRSLLRTPSKPLERLLLQNGNSAPMDFRKFHDLLGWQAGASKVCRGAVYRTEAFMAKPPSERRGMKKDGRNVHIEHTIPIKQLTQMWNLRSSTDDSEAMKWLLRNSVATAMHVNEMDRIPSELQSCNPSHRNNADRCHPFLRYAKLAESGTRVWNIYTGKPVDIASWTLDDHYRVIIDLLDEGGADPEFIAALSSKNVQQAA